MDNALAVTPLTPDENAICALVCNGDASKLNPNQRTEYYMMRCRAAGIDPRTAPFQFIALQGKLVLYALKTCSDQLASKNNIRVEVLSQETTPDLIRVVTVRATAKDGRQTDEIGCVAVKGKTGDDLGNAYMKAMTKAKRRAILSLCGLGCLDETEVETIPGAKIVPHALPKNVTPAQPIRPPQRKAAPAAAPAAPPQREASPFEQELDQEHGSPEPGSLDGPAAGDGLDELTITKITTAEGKTAKGPWKCHFVLCSNKKTYSTFDQAVADFATTAFNEHRGVLITAGEPRKTKNGECFPIVSIS